MLALRCRASCPRSKSCQRNPWSRQCSPALTLLLASYQTSSAPFPVLYHPVIDDRCCQQHLSCMVAQLVSPVPHFSLLAVISQCPVAPSAKSGLCCLQQKHGIDSSLTGRCGRCQGPSCSEGPLPGPPKLWSFDFASHPTLAYPSLWERPHVFYHFFQQLKTGLNCQTEPNMCLCTPDTSRQTSYWPECSYPWGLGSQSWTWRHYNPESVVGKIAKSCIDLFYNFLAERLHRTKQFQEQNRICPDTGLGAKKDPLLPFLLQPSWAQGVIIGVTP